MENNEQNKLITIAQASKILNKSKSWLYRNYQSVGGFKLGGSIHSSPAIGTDGTIYVGGGYDSDGKVYALNPDGSLKWSYQTGGEVISSPVWG